MMYIINTVDDYQYVYINYMEYDILRNQMMKPKTACSRLLIDNQNIYLKNYLPDLIYMSSLFKHTKSLKGAHGVEPWTSRSAVECSTTELYPLIYDVLHKYDINNQIYLLTSSTFINTCSSRVHLML